MFSKLLGLLQDNHAHAGAISSKWPTETAPVGAVGHITAQSFILEQKHRGKGLHADGVYLLLQ